MDCSPLGSSVHGIILARILLPFPSPGDLPDPGIEPASPAKMGSIKDRNGMDLTEAEDIKKRWQESTEELYKKDRHDPDV